MPEKKYKRQNYLIDRKFQLRFVAQFLLLILVSLLAFSGGMVAYFWVRYTAGENVFSEFIFIQKQVRVTDEKGVVVGTRSEMQPPINRLELIAIPILINNVIIMVILAVIGIFYSHRIAGPIYRIEQDLARILSGEKGVKIRIREKDNMKSLVAKINQLVAQYDKAE